MARSLGELFPVIVALLGAYFLYATMTSSSVLTYHDTVSPTAHAAELDIIRSRPSEDGDAMRAKLLVGVNPAPGLYAIASALCFGSVLVWSRLSPPKPAITTAAED